MVVEYTEQTLTIPADVCKILERETLLDSGYDDFGLNIEVEKGKLVITDMLEYVVKDYRSMEPEEAWELVRKWWKKAEEQNKVEIAISKKEKEILKLKEDIEKLWNKAKKWRLW